MYNANNNINAFAAGEIERQNWYIKEIRELNDKQYSITGIKPKMFIRTYGCQMNERDSEKIAGILNEMGYVSAENEKDASFVIYNTCCIRENAENKILGNLGRLKHYKEHNKNLRVALCGCMVQQEGAVDVIKNKYKNVDILFGTFNFHRLPELLHSNITTNRPILDIWDDPGDIAEDLPAIRRNRWKAGVNIMYGCDNYCAYCIVPYVRGRERSRKEDDILREVTALANDGVREILLLGQNVNSYGGKLKERGAFAELLALVSEIKGIDRIRFMTPHPKDLSGELIAVIKSRKNICNHIHLPMQSGSTAVLEKMNRNYTKEHYLSLISDIRNNLPDASVTTDIIVGFPGETEKDFEDTLDVVREARFQGAFTFIYSKRAGTPAANMAQLDVKTVKERFNRLIELQNCITEEVYASYIGKTVEVFVENISQKGTGIVTGRSEQNALVHFKGDETLLGQMAYVKITASRGFFLEGVL